MGHRGYYVYRWRGWYFIHYNHLDSYPNVLGLMIHGEVPPGDCAAGVFDNWFGSSTKRFDDDLKRYGEKNCDQPQNDTFIEWIYEIDFDNLVFHIDSIPMFRLDCMPPAPDFCDYIAFNHYGGRAYPEKMPERYRYEANWITSPPEIGKDQLMAYKRLDATVTEDIIPLAMSVVSSTRIRLLEALIGTLMKRSGSLYRNIINLRNVSSRDYFTKASSHSIWLFAWSALSPPKYGNQWEAVIAGSHYPARVSKDDCLAVWFRENLCVFAWTHLDDEPNLKAAVVAITGCLRSQSRDSDTFGVAFSLFHCVVIRLDGKTGKVTHTGVLDFLPSWYAYSLSTPGITALARLSEYLDDLSLGHPDVAVCTTEPLHTQLPHELLAQISEYICGSDTLLAYAQASVQTRAACKAMLMKPWVVNLQLLAVHPDSVLCGGQDGSDKLSDSAHANGWEDEDEATIAYKFAYLSNAKFFTLDEKGADTVYSVSNRQYYRELLQGLNIAEGILKRSTE
ncbi:hypothetical protein IW261DRAFT_1474280 [Armillaria novae-zelandiae]|uniref:Uncharacterized protein n=1 Tax=Armillaria novae-zelandiae TaxID=153914 RepID=A0AA39PAP0_9AGAR|nr:hypothetical protein IW261DRAFT_1474280 [Armillaria novae-zelandiae]